MSAEVGTSPGVYPGNPSLPKEVKEKILSTFRHTLNLYGEGKLDDCLIGCDFILKMDPRFGPAKKLLDKAKNPSADVDVSDLESLVAGTPTRQERVVALEPDRLLIRAVESHNARDFDAAMAAAEQVLAVLPGNQAAREILQKARQKKESQPQFDGARQRALEALEGGKPAEARQELEAMRRLDAEHPTIPLLERKIGSEMGARPASPDPPAPPPTVAASDGSAFSAFEQQFAMPSSEPQIAFDDTNPVGGRIPRPDPPSAPEPAGGGLDGLSLDSLSLDLPTPVAQVVPPAPDPRGGSTGPLASISAAPPPPPPPPPGSPADFWTDGPAEAEEPELLSMIPEDAFEPVREPSASSLPPPLPLESESPNANLEIQRLVAQGDEAARKGDRQQAIEIWSRIFLIDINNSEAVMRIEKVRQEMAEGNRRVTEGLKIGREQFEARDFPLARETFLQVLAVDENDATARFYLERIEAELARPFAPSEPAPSGSQDPLSAESGEAPAVTAPLSKEAPSAVRSAGRKFALRLPANKKMLAIGGLGLVIVLGAVAWFVLRPRAESAPSAAAPGAPSLEGAMALFREGKVPETVAALRQIPAGHPDHGRAQKLLESLTKASPPEAGPVQESRPEGAAPAVAVAANDPARLRAVAEQALEEKRYIDALKNFNLAAPAFADDPSFAQARARATEKVTELTPAVKLYNEGDYESAIPILWRIYSDDHSNQDARVYLERAYFNQGIAHLQNGLHERAKESFAEVLTLSPQDEEAARHKKFAERYETHDLDLMGRIYVRHIQPRH